MDDKLSACPTFSPDNAIVLTNYREGMKHAIKRMAEQACAPPIHFERCQMRVAARYLSVVAALANIYVVVSAAASAICAVARGAEQPPSGFLP